MARGGRLTGLSVPRTCLVGHVVVGRSSEASPTIPHSRHIPPLGRPMPSRVPRSADCEARGLAGWRHFGRSMSSGNRHHGIRPAGCDQSSLPSDSRISVSVPSVLFLPCVRVASERGDAKVQITVADISRTRTAACPRIAVLRNTRPGAGNARSRPPGSPSRLRAGTALPFAPGSSCLGGTTTAQARHAAVNRLVPQTASRSNGTIEGLVRSSCLGEWIEGLAVFRTCPGLRMSFSGKANEDVWMSAGWRFGRCR